MEKSTIFFILAGILIAIYLIYCYRSIYQSEKTKTLSKPIWAIICTITIPLGGILYFMFGREEKWD